MRFGQKLHKRRSTAEEHGFKFIPFTFSHNGQTHPDAVSSVYSQIDHKLRLVDSEATAIHISAAINWTASRNIRRKTTRMVEAYKFA